MEEFSDEFGLPMSYAVILFHDFGATAPDEDDALDYWESLGEPSYPVTANPDQAIFDAADYVYPGSSLPGRVLLSPQMEILGTTTGHQDDSWAWDIVRDHEGL